MRVVMQSAPLQQNASRSDQPLYSRTRPGMVSQSRYSRTRLGVVSHFTAEHVLELVSPFTAERD